MARLSINVLLLVLLILPCFIQILEQGKINHDLSSLIILYIKFADQKDIKHVAHVVPNLICIGKGGNGIFANAQEDEVEGEETDEGAVEDEEGGSEVETEDETEDVAGEEEADVNKNVHKDADTMLLFTKPSIINTFESGSVELPAGKVKNYINTTEVRLFIKFLWVTIHYITIHPN